ncbi:MAG: glutathione synthase [Oleiphilus sp.]|nr:MAG: glutathione synthase [Oleiphilus sp.]
MHIKLGIVMDPIDQINIRKDSSFAMLLAAQKRGYELYYMELSDLYLDNGNARARMRQVSVERNTDMWFSLSDEKERDLADLDVILMRKDPPVDAEFIYATHILECAEQQGTLIVNRARSLRDCNEKLYATRFPECCPPVLVSRRAEQLKAFVGQHKNVIFKPLDGMGGASIFQVKEGDPNLGVIIETLSEHGACQVMVQKYIPEIKEGDKRILIIDGKAVAHGLARIPGKGEHRGNLAAGGRGEVKALNERDHWIVDQIRDDLQARGLLFVGIDVIGDYLTEINVTSPTCIQEIDRETGSDIGDELMQAIENKLSSSARLIN